MPKLRVIYEPKGRAGEYAKLACNIFTGCTHGCTYCYAEKMSRRFGRSFSGDVKPRANFLAKLMLDADDLAAQGCDEEILFCFTCDPYPRGIETEVTRKALEIVGSRGLKATVLTKGGAKAARDFDVMKKYGIRFGTTITSLDTRAVQDAEPFAAPPEERMQAIVATHENGIETWVSLEPVIEPKQAIRVVDALWQAVDYWKVGCINHDRAKKGAVDWPKFLREIRHVFETRGCDYMIKKDLLEIGGGL